MKTVKIKRCVSTEIKTDEYTIKLRRNIDTKLLKELIEKYIIDTRLYGAIGGVPLICEKDEDFIYRYAIAPDRILGYVINIDEESVTVNITESKADMIELYDDYYAFATVIAKRGEDNEIIIDEKSHLAYFYLSKI